MTPANLFSLSVLVSVLVGCSQVSLSGHGAGDGIIAAGDLEFAVFREEGSAVAIRMGRKQIGDQQAEAKKAIERSTGCNVITDTLRAEGKSLEAALSCLPSDVPPFVMTQTPQI